MVTVQNFFAASNVLIVAGKGGVGKTTVGAVIAFAAARSGCDVLLIELEGYSNLEPLGFGSVGPEPRRAAEHLLPADAGVLEVMQLRPDEALADYLDRTGMGPIIKTFSRTGAVEVVVAAAPGLRDLVTLGKIRQLEEAGRADLIVVDAPASGHALSLLTAAAGMADSASGGPIREQADQALAMLGDETRCRVVLVTLPEETPVSETIETAFDIEDEVGVKLGPVIVNGLWPEIEGLADAVDGGIDGAIGDGETGDGTPAGDDMARRAADYTLTRTADQQAQVARLSAELPLPQIHLPQLFTAALGPGDLATLADALAASPVVAGDGARL